MDKFVSRRMFRVGVATTGLLALAACGAKDAPPVVAVAPPKIVVPPQPMPPMGASPNLVVPAMTPTGVRQTINTGASQTQVLWNLRSAYNVAALNCQQPQHAPILANYKTFLTAHAKTLTAANRKVDQEFKTRYGASFIRPREAYMTQVYNFYALPPTLLNFCDAALAVSNESQSVKSADLEAFAAQSLPRLDRVFENFYLSYEQYRTDLSAWKTRYTPPTVVTLAPAGFAPTGAALSAPAQ